MKSRKNKVSRNRRTKKNIGGAEDILSDPVTPSSMDDIANNDLTTGFVPLNYISTEPLMCYASENSSVGLPQIKFEIDQEITRIYQDLMENEGIVGPNGENIPYEQWKQRTKMSNPMRNVFGIVTYKVSEMNRLKYLFLYYLKSIFIQSYKDSDTYNKIDVNLINSMNIVINAINRAMKYIENTETSVSLNEIVHRLILKFHLELNQKNLVFLHPFMYVYAYLFDHVINVEAVEVKRDFYRALITIHNYNFDTNLYIKNPIFFIIKMKKQDDGRSLHYLQTIIPPTSTEDETIPVPFLPITYEERDYKSIVKGVPTYDGTNYTNSCYPLDISCNGVTYTSSDSETPLKEQINIINFNDIQQEVENFIQTKYGDDSLSKRLFIRELRFYKCNIDRPNSPKLYHSIDLNNITKEELTKKMYYVFRLFAHMNLYIDINVSFIDIDTIQDSGGTTLESRFSLSQFSFAVKLTYIETLTYIRDELKKIFIERPKLIDYIMKAITHDQEVFKRMLIPENVTTFINSISSNSTVMDKPKFEAILNELKRVVNYSQYRTLVVEIDKIVIPGEGDGLELISLQDYQRKPEYYEHLVQSRFPETPVYDFNQARCKVNIYSDGSFEPISETNCIKMDENFGESRILSILGTTSFSRQNSDTSIRCSKTRKKGTDGRVPSAATSSAAASSAAASSATSKRLESAATLKTPVSSAPSAATSSAPSKRPGSSSAPTSASTSASTPTSAPPPAPKREVRVEVPQLVKIPTVRITFNPEQMNVYFQKWLENSSETGFNEQHFSDMNKQIAYSKLFSLYGHPHIRTMPYLYANCNGMFTKDSWIKVCDEFIKGIKTFPQQYEQICEKSGKILKLEKIFNPTSENDDPIAENTMIAIKANTDYIIFSVLINCMVRKENTNDSDNEPIVIVLMRTGTANKDCKAEVSEQMSITFQIMEREDKGFITLNPDYELLESNLYETIRTILVRRHLELKRIESIELIMMHKKAVECVQSYLDNSNSNVCGEILNRIETSVDNLMRIRM